MPASLYILLEAPNIVMLTLYRNMEVQQKVFSVLYVCEGGWSKHMYCRQQSF